MSNSIEPIDLCDDDDELHEVLDLTQEPEAKKGRGRKRQRETLHDDDEDVVIMGESSSMRREEAGPSNRELKPTTIPSISLHRPPLVSLITNDKESFTLDCGCSFPCAMALQSDLLDRITAASESHREQQVKQSKGRKKAPPPPPPPPRNKLGSCTCAKCSTPLSHRDIRNLLPNMNEIYLQAATSNLPLEAPAGGSSSSSVSIKDLIDELRAELLSDSAANGKGKKGAKKKQSKSKTQGTGYGGAKDETGTLKAAQGLASAAKRQVATDNKTISILDQITETIKGSMKGGGTNRTQPPPPSLVAHIFSSLPFLLRLLLSNDSMTDLAHRQQLYRSVIQLLHCFSSSNELVEVFLLSTRDSADDDDDHEPGEKQEPPTILAVLYQLNRQCLVYRRSAMALGDGDEACISALSLTLELSSLHDDVTQSVGLFCLSMGQSVNEEDKKEQPDGKSRKKKAKAEVVPDSVRDSRYIASIRAVQFSEVEGLLDSHFFRQEASKSKGGGGEVMRKRLRRITEEVSTLATSLPAAFDSCICLAVDSERMDLLRAVIFPASETPYSNGAFLFDIFLPSDYPQVPPKVQFLTTGGGTVRFNPNLYAEGKVCLSLLGTWQGPSWDPGTSTLLQVLISIQAMILVNDPWFNEPGFEKRAATAQGKEESRSYNESLRTETLRLAVLPMVELACGQSSGKSSGSGSYNPLSTFTDAVKIHVEAMREVILDQCRTWLHECKLKASKKSMKTSVDNISKLLKA